jgi:hypothetical protein
MSKRSFFAVFVGSIVAIVLSYLLESGFEFYLISSHRVLTLTDPARQQRLLSAIESSADLAAGQLSILVASGIVSGYITATIADRRRIVICLLASILPLAANALSFLSAIWLGWRLVSTVAVIGTPGWFAFGGYFRVLQLRWRPSQA